MEGRPDARSDHRAELAEFLRARRDAVAPEQVGLPRGAGHRRAPGLRREEVALLAGVSLTWYTWLEQGRRINASPDVLAAIGRALRLDEAGIEHLQALAQPTLVADRCSSGGADGPGAADRADGTRAGLRARPALGVPRVERRASSALPAHRRARGIERNLLWVLFADPYIRELIVDWDIHARQALAEFRAATTAHRNDPEFAELIGKLQAESAEFAAWWPEHGVSQFETRLRRFQHPAAGLLTFEYQQLAPVEWPSLRVACQLPVPGDDSAERLAVRHYLV